MRQAEALIKAGMPAGKADRIAARTALVSGRNIAPASLGRWRRRVKDAKAGSRVSLLLERPRTGRPGEITPEQAATLEALLWHHGPHLTARHARRVLVARHSDQSGERAGNRPNGVPGLDAVKRWIKRWREENAASLSAVLAPDRHRSLRMPAFGTAGTAICAEGLNVLWEIDSTLCDVICSDGRRRALIAVIDVWSRRALFLVSRTSRASAIAALLRRAILLWGVPQMLVTDEGKDYVSRHVEGLLCDLEIDHRPCLPYRPDLKPHIERLIGTVSRDLFAFLPGFCGHDVSQAKALRERTAFAERRGRKHGQMNGQKNEKAAPTVLGADLDAHDLQRRLDIWAEDIYARRAHRGLIRTGNAEASEQTPFGRALSWTGPVRRVESERALDVLIAAPAGGGTRTVTKHGIFLGGRIYIGAELGPLVGARVAVRHDPQDEHGLIVFDCSGRFIGRARDCSAPETDRAAIAAEARRKAARRDAAARARAKKTAKDHRPETAMDDVLRGARQEAARIAVLPCKTEPGAEPWTESRTEPYDTPALRQADAASKANVAATANVAAAADAASRDNVVTGAAGRTGTGNAAGFGGHSRALVAAARLFFDDDD